MSSVLADSGLESCEHPGTEAEPPLVLMSPFVSVARGGAAASLVTRAVDTRLIPFGRMLSNAVSLFPDAL